MDIQKLVDTISEIGEKERSNYHATLGDLIDKLEKAKEDAEISPEIVGIGAYRGYYSDIALCTESGSDAYKSELDYNSPTKDWEAWDKENRVEIKFSKNPHELAEQLKSLIGMYFDGYKGGYNKITREKPLWLATDDSDCSDNAVIDISDDLKLTIKQVE